MASRNSVTEEEIEHNDRFESLGIEKGLKKVLCCDFDTLIYWTLVSYNEDGSKRELVLEDLPELEGKLSEMVLGIFNKLEQYFVLDKIWIFIRGKNNFRKNLYNLYKSNRPEKHPLTNYLYESLKTKFGAVEVDGYEAEDACYTIGKKLGQECIIAYCDHDLLETPNCILYNYQKDFFLIQSEKEALWEKYKKINLGENGDFANFTPSYGLKKFERDFNKEMTEEEYEKQTYETFLYCWSDKTKVKNKTIRTPNPEKAQEMLKLAKEIIFLKEVKTENEQ